jgi:hypothetical protein
MLEPESTSNPKKDRFFVITSPEDCVTESDGEYYILFSSCTLRLLESHKHFNRCFRTDGHYKLGKDFIKLKVPGFGLVGMWSQTQDPLLKGYPGALQISTTESKWAYTGLCKDVTVAVYSSFVHIQVMFIDTFKFCMCCRC